MPNPAWLYHKTQPQGVLYPDLTPELTEKLTAEGWIDSPAGLVENANGAEPVPRATPAAMTVGNGRALGSEPVKPSAPTPADLRFAQLFDDTGAPVHGNMDTVTLWMNVMDMSREEVLAALEMTGVKTDPVTDTQFLRTALMDALRPSEAADDVVTEDPLDPETADQVEKSVEAMTEDEREAWLTDPATTKAMMKAVLDERKVSYKARDGVEELQEAIRLTFAPKE